MTVTFEIPTEEDTARLGTAIAKHLFGGLAFTLDGPMGAGKTTLTCAVMRALGYDDARSPTFALVNRYDTRTLTVLHADLYRLDRADSREFAFDEELDDGCALIVEWPDRLVRFDPPRWWQGTFTLQPRQLTIKAVGPEAEQALKALKEDLHGRVTGP